MVELHRAFGCLEPTIEQHVGDPAECISGASFHGMFFREIDSQLEERRTKALDWLAVSHGIQSS